MRPFWQRITSRKFIVAFMAQLAGILAFFWPAHADPIVEICTKIGGLVVLVVAAIGYGVIESRADRQPTPAEDKPRRRAA